MSDIIAACVSQFHDDENSFELLLAYADGREVGHSVSRSVARRIASELINATGGEYADKDAEEIDKLRSALEEIAKTNQIREFMGDDVNDGYGNEGWVFRDGQYAKIARAALSSAEGSEG